MSLHDIVDVEVVEQLFAYDDEGDDSFSTDMFLTFDSQCAETLERMRRDLCTRNYDDLSQAGHFLKGSALQVGAKEVARICAEIEYTPRNFTVSEQSILADAIAAYRATLQQWRAK